MVSNDFVMGAHTTFPKRLFSMKVFTNIFAALMQVLRATHHIETA
jgi:hypothetical protein